MMGHRAPMKGGDEYDALTGWRRFLRWRPGQRKKAKRKFNRRQRHETKLRIVVLYAELNEEGD